jgi:hypothetical protein
MGIFICLPSVCPYQQYCSERSACFLALLFVYKLAYPPILVRLKQGVSAQCNCLLCIRCPLVSTQF